MKQITRKQVVDWLVTQGFTRSGKGNVKMPFVAKGVRDDKTGRLRVTMTTNAIDRHGDIVEPKGGDLKAFRKAPRVQWAHDYTRLPIARAENVRKDGDSLTAEIEWWQGAGESDASHLQFVNEVRAMYEHKPPFLNTWSIGFMPTKWEGRVAETKEGEGDDQFLGYHITKWELLELSAVPVPANAEAVSALSAEGIVTHKALVKSLGLILDKATKPEGTWKYCVCKKCGHWEEHKAGKPCGDIECPDCGEPLIGSDEKPEKAKEADAVDAKEFEELAEDVAELKEGRVISGRNRKKLLSAKEAFDSLSDLAAEAGDVIQELLDLSDTSKSVDESQIELPEPEPEPKPKRAEAGRQVALYKRPTLNLSAAELERLAGRVCDAALCDIAQNIGDAVESNLNKRLGRV